MSKLIFRSLGLVALLVAVSALAWTPARAEEMTCPEHTPVMIDIKPGSNPNSVNLASNGLLPVAVLSTPGFEAALFTPEMAHLSDAALAMDDSCSGAMPVRWALDDVNRDGKADLVFFFKIQELNFTSSTTAATFMAHGSYNGSTLHIQGTDAVRVVFK